MLRGPSGSRIFVACEPVDLRKSYCGLAALVEGYGIRYPVAHPGHVCALTGDGMAGEANRRRSDLAGWLAGAVLEGGAVAINLGGTSVLEFRLTLLALGVGWNFLFIAATTLLAETYAPHERTRAHRGSMTCSSSRRWQPLRSRRARLVSKRSDLRRQQTVDIAAPARAWQRTDRGRSLVDRVGVDGCEAGDHGIESYRVGLEATASQRESARELEICGCSGRAGLHTQLGVGVCVAVEHLPHIQPSPPGSVQWDRIERKAERRLPAVGY